MTFIRAFILLSGVPLFERLRCYGLAAIFVAAFAVALASSSSERVNPGPFWTFTFIAGFALGAAMRPWSAAWDISTQGARYARC